MHRRSSMVYMNVAIYFIYPPYPKRALEGISRIITAKHDCNSCRRDTTGGRLSSPIHVLRRIRPRCAQCSHPHQLRIGRAFALVIFSLVFSGSSLDSPAERDKLLVSAPVADQTRSNT
ncbi:hypothetical protein PYCCODRAFT_792405 [Trametes coccinea BRFM310]|uniref:Uncharacterized protein n=1 Tax=Trametes coccinea (strain BRFM310) TaxID=1353009 RepID=A0A1Y2J2N4_TRAC3|nr:hypothetical protein PYCCODRAFT_792405 [Trametes coccinea BRFM310]